MKTQRDRDVELFLRVHGSRDRREFGLARIQNLTGLGYARARDVLERLRDLDYVDIDVETGPARYVLSARGIAAAEALSGGEA